MKKLSILLALLCAGLFTAEARPVRGTVRSGGKGLAEVVVSDGTSFALTDRKGRFTLEVTDDAPFVFVITPRGYIAPLRDGFPFFYRPSDAEELAFELDPLPGDDYALLAVGDPQPKTAAHFRRMEREAAPDLRATGEAYAREGVAVVGLYLGDMLWDNLDKIGRFRAFNASLGVPFYPLIGNHDHDLTSRGDDASAHVYRDNFGPTYYAFNLGRDYYIVLDNIDYAGDKVYTEDLTPRQIEWLRAYAAFIPRGASVTIAMHCPVKKYFLQDGGLMPSTPEVLEIFRDHRLSFLTGHSHIHSNFEVVPGVREHMVASIGGIWWAGDCRFCKDGTPLGYQVFESKEGQRQYYFKTLDRDRSYQMELFDRGAFGERPASAVAKIWNWDPRWTVTWSEDGVERGAMTQFTAYDPQFAAFVEKRRAQGKPEMGAYKQPVRSFMFFAAEPSAEARSIAVTAVDPFGNRYTDTIRLAPHTDGSRETNHQAN